MAINRKIMFCLSANPFQTGGGATVVTEIMKHIHLSDEVSVIAPRNCKIPTDIKKNIRLIRIWMPSNNILNMLYMQLFLPIILCYLRPTRLIFLDSILPLLYPFRMDLFYQMRMFYYKEWDTIPKKVKNFLGVLSCHRAANVYCASVDHARDLIEQLNLKQEKVKTIHLGVRVSKIGSHHGMVRSNDLLFVSVIRPYKNLDLLVKAIAHISIKRPDLAIRLNIIGSVPRYRGISDYIAQIDKLILKYNLIDNIKFHGVLPHHEVLRMMYSCKALIFPTKFEGFGLPLLEAMSTKTPVITSSVSSLPEIGGNTVEYFDVDSVEDLSEKIISLYSLGYDTQKLKNAYLRAKQFDWRRTVVAILENSEHKVT